MVVFVILCNINLITDITLSVQNKYLRYIVAVNLQEHSYSSKIFKIIVKKCAHYLNLQIED